MNLFLLKTMDTASIIEIKKELQDLPAEELVNHCLRLVKYKKENKELLSYLLFDSFDENHFIQKVKEEIDLQFADMNKSSLYLAKKTLRKVLRTTNKYIKFTNSKVAELELNIYFTQKFKASGLEIHRSKVLSNMYIRQLQRINKTLKTLHEDLHFDYKDEIDELGNIQLME